MLSIKNLGSASGTSHYFEKDDYYTKDSEEARENSGWQGQGAERIELCGKVDAVVFRSLLEGNMPDGSMVGRLKADGEVEHAPGMDLTFSAPKSVSLVGLIGGDSAVIDAHKEAVEATLNFIEEEGAHTRSMDNAGIVQREYTGNLVIAKFDHTTSRAVDPQLHTHSIIMNLTQNQDGEWRSLDNRDIYQNKMLAGLIYRAELADRLKSLGYEIGEVRHDGTFEIEGISKEEISHFSKRREEVKTAMEERGLEGAINAARAAIMTRSAKQEIPREELHALWDKEAAEIGLGVDRVVEEARVRSVEPKELGDVIPDRAAPSIEALQPHLIRQEKAVEAVSYATRHLAERESVFTERDLKRVALIYGMGQISHEDVIRAINSEIESKGLIDVENGQVRNYKDEAGRGFTTPDAIKLESDTIKVMKEGMDQVNGIVEEERVRVVAAEKGLNEGQTDAAALILGTTDRVVGIQGYAGTGKTFMLDVVRELAEERGYQVRGFAPSATAAGELAESAGIESTTVASLLQEINKGVRDGERLSPNELKARATKGIWVIDESSMVSTKDMNRILNSANELGARVVQVGDYQQLAAIDAGKPFHQLQRNGMAVAVMKDILRQKDEQTRGAVEDTIHGDIKKAFAKIDKGIEEIEGREARLDRIAKEFLSMSPEERERALVLAPMNVDREALIEKIREGLKKEGSIKEVESGGQILDQKGLTKVEKERVSSYNKGDQIRFNKSYKTLGVESGDYAKVVDIDRKSKLVTLEKSDGNQVKWKPDSLPGHNGRIEVFESHDRHLSEGDKIRWTKNFKDMSIFNSETAKVLSVEKERATFELANGDQHTLDLSKRSGQHWDLAYASTVHAAQGKTADKVLVYADSTQKNLINQQSFYVTISRARYGVSLYTDNKDRLIKGIEDRTGEKAAALESKYRGKPMSHAIGKDGLLHDHVQEERVQTREIERGPKMPEIVLERGGRGR